MRKINVLSLFDGIGGARIALDQLGIECNYYSSEIDTHCVEVHQHNYPDTIQLGDVEKINLKDLPHIDLLIGGSPCQSLSGLVNLTDKTKGFAGKSKLFFDYVRILKEINPTYFVLENVASMKDQDRDIMSQYVGASPIKIDSRLLTAQVRKRYYWTNMPGIEQPDDLGIKLKDILESGYTEKERAYCLTATYFNACVQNYFIKSERQHKFLQPVTKEGYTYHIGDDVKIEIIPSKGADANRPALHEIRQHTSMLSPLECERLQGIPDNKKTIYLYVWKENYTDHQKSFVGAENKNHKLQKHVQNAEKEDLKEIVVYAENNLNTNSQLIDKRVENHVLINCEERKVEILSQNKLLFSVNSADVQKGAHLQKSVADFVRSIVFMNTISDLIIKTGKGESLLKENKLLQQRSGENVLSLFGKEIMQLAKDVETDSITHKKLLKSTISSLLNTSNLEQIEKILSCYVIHAINGFTQEKINLENSLIEINFRTGYTFIASEKERYRMIGNGFTVPVIKHILSKMRFED